MATIKCSWSLLTTNPIESSVKFHPSHEFKDVNSTDLETLVEPDLTCMLQDSAPPSSCVISVEPAENGIIVASVIICDCPVIEAFAPRNSGYIQSTKGIVIDEFEGTVVYGHIVDVQENPVRQLDLTMIHKKDTATITIFGIHVYAQKSEIPARSFDVGGLLQNLTEPNPSVIPFNLLNRKIDALRSDLSAMEQRIKSHFDQEFDKLSRDIFARFDALERKVQGSSKIEEIEEESNKRSDLARLPVGTFDLNEFKWIFSNDVEMRSTPYLWENFDKDNYSIWFCDYKYPEDLTEDYKSLNLISGMFQRLDGMRKYAFATMILFDADNSSTISGVWIWRGQGLAFQLDENWTVDYESYTWNKLDPSSPETKKVVDEYLAWEGDFEGKTFKEGKIFK